MWILKWAFDDRIYFLHFQRWAEPGIGTDRGSSSPRPVPASLVYRRTGRSPVCARTFWRSISGFRGNAVSNLPISLLWGCLQDVNGWSSRCQWSHRQGLADKPHTYSFRVFPSRNLSRQQAADIPFAWFTHSGRTISTRLCPLPRLRFVPVYVFEQGEGLPFTLHRPKTIRLLDWRYPYPLAPLRASPERSWRDRFYNRAVTL